MNTKIILNLYYTALISPRITVPWPTTHLLPKKTSPTTVAFGAIKLSLAVFGYS